MKMYNGYPRLPRDYTLLADEYAHTMAYGWQRTGKDKDEAVFDVFFRKVPNGGGYGIMAGVDQIIEHVKNINYTGRNLDYFIKHNRPKEYIENLKKIKGFSGDIYAIPDGTPIFPNEPILTVRGPQKEVELLEASILAILNGAISHATGARRIIEATTKDVTVVDNPLLDEKEIKWLEKHGRIKPRQKTPVMEFGARRADGLEAAINSSLYGIMAGCVGTSNIMAAHMLDLEAMGTMAHCYMGDYPNEFEAFKAFALTYPDNCILLVDTYDTLRSGVPNAIKTFKYMEENGISTDKIGIRIDSGDLAYLSKEAKKMLVEAGFPQAKICLSNGLKAETIESLKQQGAVFNSLGVGDNISKPEGNVGCVYKEMAINQNGIWVPKIKLSNDTIKITNPGYKKLYRAYDRNTGYALADVMALKDQEIPKNDLTIVSVTDPLKRTVITNYDLVEIQQPIFLNGELVYEDKDVMDIQKYCNEQMDTIYPEVKRTLNPHEYYVDGTEEYMNLKVDEIHKAKQLVKKREL